jgi:hypothetical protein
MYTIREQLVTADATQAEVPWGKGATLALAMHNAANAITDETDGLIDHVDNATCLQLYMQHTGSKLVFAYEAQYVVRYGEAGSKGVELGRGNTVARAMQDALRTHNDSISAPNVTWEQMVTEYLATDWCIWVTKE